MERALERQGETRPIYEILRSLAKSLRLEDFFPWGSVEEILDAILDHPTTGHATVASLRAAGCGLDSRRMGRAQSPHIWGCGSDRRCPHSVPIFGWPVRLW